MARLIVCDRCKAQIERRDLTGYVALQWREVKSGDIASGPNAFDEWDFCDECMKELDELIRNKYVIKEPEAEEEQEEIEEEDPVEEEPASTQVKKRVDVGAIKALYEAGLSVKDIAADPLVRTTETTVYKYIKEMGLQRRRR